MKFFVPLLALTALALSACSTDANRRALYSPKKADGPWTRSLDNGSYKYRELPGASLPGHQKPAVGVDWPDRTPGWRIRKWTGN